jgi:hypothetical protein
MRTGFVRSPILAVFDGPFRANSGRKLTEGKPWAGLSFFGHFGPRIGTAQTAESLGPEDRR